MQEIITFKSPPFVTNTLVYYLIRYLITILFDYYIGLLLMELYRRTMSIYPTIILPFHHRDQM